MKTPACQADAGNAFVTLLTPEGQGAIAVVRVWGPDALVVVDRVFRPHRGHALARTVPGRPRLGRLGRGRGDEVVAIVLGGEPPSVEVQCHGGYAALDSVFGALEEAGAKRSPSGHWVESRCGDPIACAAISDLPRAPTLRTAEILLDQAHGALRTEILRIQEAIPGKPELGLSRLDALLARAELGLRLLSGWKVAIAGRPNVGKSRLFNALAGFARAIVDPAPGTTRDVVTARASFDGWPMELADTAGLRGTDEEIESEGIARARREQEKADLVLVVLDRSEPLLARDVELIGATRRALGVANKSDLPAAWQPSAAGLDPSTLVTVSAERGDGLSMLIEAIVCRLIPDAPAPGEAVPFRREHLERLKHARASLLAADPTAALAALAEVTCGSGILPFPI